MTPNLFLAPDGHLVEFLHRAVDERRQPVMVFRLFPDGLGVFVVPLATWERGFREQAAAVADKAEAAAWAERVDRWCKSLPREAENRG